ncbi:major facilitator superfamily domain-containing protein [Coniella lustricola]|uniref:Major facilitator superfamily domain-containing protein n=1 Tax=Coniella lustricola TaxID=2025994 RepID=A0A2T3AH85_9PEZI|nr:major facilitator superfamily domain-containing protein [Coniella lustricola]
MATNRRQADSLGPQIDTERGQDVQPPGDHGPRILIPPSQAPSPRILGADQESRATRGHHDDQPSKQKEAVSWNDLPHKQQLLVIVLTRLSEPLVQTSLQSYMFYQLKWFDPALPDSVISSQAGILHASFTGAQLFTAMLWGRVADSSRFGRKTVVLIGLMGTMLSCLGFGFSTTFWQALVFRSLGGITNGNVGVLRTMISELVREKKYQQRAFVLLPMTFNIGVIVGPILGGLLADPAKTYPSLFGESELLRRFPYALPNLVSALFLVTAALSAWLRLEETLDARADRRDYGIELGRRISAALSRWFSRGSPESVEYQPLTGSEEDGDTSLELEQSPIAPATSAQSSIPQQQQQQQHSPSSPSPTPTPPLGKRRPRYTQRLAFRRIFTRNVCVTVLTHSLLGFHVGTFNSLWFVFLSTPVYDPNSSSTPHRHLPFIFTGGLGLPPAKVGLAMSILGIIGITLQLFVYPALSARLGTVNCLRLFLLCFPVAYALLPFLALVPSTSPSPAPKSGLLVWMAIATVLWFQVVGRTFALPSSTILVNNCSPHPSVLGTLHGLAQSCTSAARTVGPVVCGYLYGAGLAGGVVGAVWWGLSCFAAVGWLASWMVQEGDGHEIWLEGDSEE